MDAGLSMFTDDKLKEECGVFGMLHSDGMNVAKSIYYGLSALQHRGQESAGIAVCDTDGPRGNICYHKIHSYIFFPCIATPCIQVQKMAQV